MNAYLDVSNLNVEDKDEYSQLFPISQPSTNSAVAWTKRRNSVKGQYIGASG
jgi:hypothetical protein